MATVRSRKRKGGTYWFIVDRFGRERRMGSGSAGKSAANRARARLELAEWAERRGEPTPDSARSYWTLRDLRDHDLEANAGHASLPSRRRLWEVLLEGFGEGVRLDQLTPTRIQGWATIRGRAVSARTVNNGLSLLSAALKFARRMRHASGFTGNPFSEVSRLPAGPERATVVAPDGDVQRLISAAWAKASAAPLHFRDLWRDNAAIVELLYLTSSRISQVLALRREQVRGGLLCFPAHKGGSPREFPVRGRLAAVLRRLPDRGVYFFPARAGAKKKAHRDNLAGFWRAIAPAGLTPHGLRHSAATAALYAGESLPEVAARLGHKDLTMVQRRYGHIFRKPIPPLPRAGQETAGNSGRPRLGNAREQATPAHPTKAQGKRKVNPGRTVTSPGGRRGFS
jgi:integrase